MKHSISNIAWPTSEDEKIQDYLVGRGIKAIEIAPSKYWTELDIVDNSKVKEFALNIKRKGMTICSMHSLFYTSNNMKIFGDDTERKAIIEEFIRIINLAELLGVPRMVFGSPKVRARGTISYEESFEIASEVFREVGDYAEKHGTKVLIEPLSIEDTDFINTHAEGIKLVNMVGSKGFGLHLDAKAISSEEDDVEKIIVESGSMIEHFHVNEPSLGSLSGQLLEHETMGKALKKIDYQGYISVEMKMLDDYYSEIKKAIDIMEKYYG